MSAGAMWCWRLLARMSRAAAAPRLAVHSRAGLAHVPHPHLAVLPPLLPHSLTAAEAKIDCGFAEEMVQQATSELNLLVHMKGTPARLGSSCLSALPRSFLTPTALPTLSLAAPFPYLHRMEALGGVRLNYWETIYVKRFLAATLSMMSAAKTRARIAPLKTWCALNGER